jgi:hypothetical protein
VYICTIYTFIYKHSDGTVPRVERGGRIVDSKETQTQPDNLNYMLISSCFWADEFSTSDDKLTISFQKPNSAVCSQCIVYILSAS